MSLLPSIFLIYLSEFIFFYINIICINLPTSTKKRQKPCKIKVSDACQTGDEGIEPPPKVLETPIIPFDQSPIYRKNLTPVAALNFPGTLFCTFRISHRKYLPSIVHFQVNFFFCFFAYLQSLSLRNL